MNSMKSPPLLICNLDRTDELNERILARNIPDRSLDINFEFRAQPTKYVYLPTIDKNQCEISEKKEPYVIEDTFNPGNKKGPWTGFMNRVDHESKLRNQIVPLQNNDHLVYIPKDTSDLYKNIMPYMEKINMSHLKLFEKSNFSSSENEINLNNLNLAQNIFNNDTRQQLKDS